MSDEDLQEGQEMKTFHIYVPREFTLSINIEADSLEEAKEIAIRKFRESRGQPVPGIEVLSSRWMDPSERPWIVVESPKKTLPKEQKLGELT